MKPSAALKLGTAFRIDVLLHWSFFLLPLMVVWMSRSQGDPISQTAVWMVLLVMILACVLIHEFGHALAARALGIPIIDIMLTPVCGLARLQHAPNRPRDEILVSLAGPVANLICAALLALLIWLRGVSFSVHPELIRGNLLLAIFWINAALFALNLLPIFPMDGGRILRAFLATVTDSGNATLLAARLGQVFSVGTLLAGVYWQVFPLVLIGIFLLITAEQEVRQLALDPQRGTLEE